MIEEIDLSNIGIIHQDGSRLLTGAERALLDISEKLNEVIIIVNSLEDESRRSKLGWYEPPSL